MPTPSRTRIRLVVAAVAVMVLAGGIVLLVARDDDGEVDAARNRTSPPASRDDETRTTAPQGTGSASTETTATPAGEDRPTGTDPRIRLEQVTVVDNPSAVVDLPGEGPVLVATLDGRVLLVDLDTGAEEVVLDLRDRLSTGGERGLLGMAVDPEGARVYLDYTDTGGDTDIRSWALEDGRPVGGPGAGVLHLELGQPYPNHNGGNLVFGPDGLLWIGTGDGGSAGDPGEVAQDPGRLLGKMLRVQPDPAGGLVAPASNPAWGGRPEVWAIGLRNPWRYSFDRLTGRLWVADVGQNSVEEVSVVDADAAMPNFGWDDVEGDRPYEGQPDPSFVAPVVTYDHSEGCSITGGYVYRGDAIASLYGWYLFADYCSGWIRAVPAEDPTVAPVELVAGAGAVLSFAQLDDGELLVLGRDGIRRVVAA